MSEREYIVTLNKGVDYEAFNAEMIASTGAGDIPQRTVEVTNARPLSTRNTHYSLTDAEATALSSDSRVTAVEIPPDQRDDIEMVQYATQAGTTMDRTGSTVDATRVNWGLLRCDRAANPYTTTAVPAGANHTYNLDGSGVDIVIQDSGIEYSHPEFNNANGQSRVELIDWYSRSGLSGVQNANHYRDYDGHGTHCAGIAAGKNYGWAKNSQIFSVKVGGLEGPGDTGTGIPTTDCFDVITGWHNNKPVDELTGSKRPTIVNMSWGYGRVFGNSITAGEYRGVAWTGTTRDTAKGMIGAQVSVTDYRHVIRVASVDADVEEMIDAGIIVCIAAGNSYQKIDVDGGVDYDNFYTSSGSDIYYHRGGSPFSTRAMVVGNIDDNVTGGEVRAASSEHGPGVNILAPGTGIMSTTSVTNKFGATPVAYPLNEAYKSMSISGTSMASPQVAGVAALYLQAYPARTPAQVSAWLIANSKTDQLNDTGLTNDYTDATSLLGGPNRYLFNPYNKAMQNFMTGTARVVNGGGFALRNNQQNPTGPQ
jgi:subtilisin family serine protease|tara:strand:- start:5111 stop:6721 length:1611 start_codon:yes stop_codon:yes gene_type:complete